jgi:uncharacterized protein (TIGR03382 family)
MALSIHALGGVALAASGDVDEFGYIVRGSHDEGNPYEYEQALVPVSLDEEKFVTVSLPFNFSFYGVGHQSVEIHDNGGISFGLTHAFDYDHDCAALDHAAPTVWAHWADMAPTQAGAEAGIFYSIFGEAPNRRFVVEWDRIPIWNVGGSMSFEIKLFETDGRIEFHYTDVKVDDGSRNNGADAVVGISDGTRHLLYSCDEAELSDPGSGDETFAITFFPPCEDVDKDDFCPPPGPDEDQQDCDDTDATRYPGAPELCDGLDNDCNGSLPPAEQDVDGDGQMACEGDCDDGDAGRHSGADELCNGIDDDCNDTLPPSERDIDEDGYAPCQGDCNDNSADLNPKDTDGDDVSTCDGDCNDGDPLILPGAAEQCDGIDNNCNDVVDDNPNCDRPGDELPLGVPYGCLLTCNAAAEPGSGLWPLALFPLLARRRRSGWPG